MKTSPMRCSVRASAGVTRVDVYDDIGPGFLGDGLTAKTFAAQLNGVHGPLDVHINSCGGDVGDGLAISNAIRGYRGGFRRTIVDGLAASIASVIFQAGDERVVEPGGMIMIHDPFTAAVGNAADLRKLADDLDRHGENLAEQYARRAGGTPGQWRDVMRAETWYKAEDAVAAGLADRVGGGAAELPAGFDAAVFDAVPGRIAAALRSLPQAAGLHPPFTGSHHHGHSAYGHPTGDDDGMHSHPHDHDGDADHGPGAGHAHDSAAAAPPQAAQPHPYQPQPYHRDPDENVECPVCHLFDDTDAKFCDQCGTKLTGRDDVRVLPAGVAGQGHGPRNIAGDRQLGDGWVRGADGRIRFDPDGDGDDDSTPEGDTDHDYFAADGTPLKPVPPLPSEPADALTEERVRAILREEVARAAAARADDSPWDASKAWHNGAASDDPAKFYAAICAGEKTTGDPGTQDHWALPYRYTPSSPPNAAAVRNCLARLSQTRDLKDPDAVRRKLQDLMKQINPDYEPEDHASTDLAGTPLAQIRAALKGARA